MSPISRLFRHFRPTRAADLPSEHAGAIDWVVAGLGNPGEEYHRSRHNVGFMTLDRVVATHRAEFSRRRFKAACAMARIAGRNAILVKAETFYNLSGESLAAILGYYKVPIQRLIVIHDDLDLEAGRIRIKRAGGDAGNRGVRSIADHLGSDFIRIRIGIGRPPGEGESKDFVLKPMTRAEIAQYEPVLARAAEAVEALMVEDLERVMGRYNQRQT